VVADDRERQALYALTSLVVALALAVALAGLFWNGGKAPETFTSVRGTTVDIYGSGIYRHDSVIRATANRGADLVTLAIALPVLITSLVLSRRGSIRAHLMLYASLIWFLYNSASLALGTAFNELFLVYVALMSASMFALILAFRCVNTARLAARLNDRVPRRSLAMFMFLAGLITLAIWLIDPMQSLLTGEPPAVLEHSTTLITHALDLAFILPAAVLAGVFIWKEDPLGHILAMPILFIVAMLTPMISAQTAFQINAGVDIPLAVAIGPIGGFLIISLFGISFLVRLIRGFRVVKPAYD
jgi:hypothetical protein